MLQAQLVQLAECKAACDRSQVRTLLGSRAFLYHIFCLLPCPLHRPLPLFRPVRGPLRCTGGPQRHGEPVESRQTIQTWNTGLDGFSDNQTKSKPCLNQYQTYVPNQMQTNTKPFFFEWYKPMSNLVQTKIKLGVAAGQALSQTELQRNRRLRQIGQQLNHG